MNVDYCSFSSGGLYGKHVVACGYGPVLADGSTAPEGVYFTALTHRIPPMTQSSAVSRSVPEFVLDSPHDAANALSAHTACLHVSCDSHQNVIHALVFVLPPFGYNSA
jgi:hypothetical protein